MFTNSAARRMTRIAATALFLSVAGSMSGAMAADAHFIADNAAISGYDVVAFHTAGAPAKGSAEFKAEFQGVDWLFSSAANRDLFKADPAKYIPAYGGWCTAGASKGKKVVTKPGEFWSIVDGRLYLNSSQAAHEKLFLADTAGVIRKGEMNWKVIYATPADQL